MQELDVKVNKILSHLDPSDFIGRSDELEAILRHAKNETNSNGLVILSAPTNGLSELLRQAYDRLFNEQGDVIPVYFSFSKNDKNAEQVARRFLQTVLLQVVAFRRADPRILDSAPDICEISELSVPADGYWIDRLVKACDSNSWLRDERSFVIQALRSPLRAKANGANVFVMFDNFEYAENIKGDINLIDELKEIYGRSIVSFVFGGRRRFVLNALQSGRLKLSNFEILRLSSFTEGESRQFSENCALKSGVKLNPQTIDLLGQQFDGNMLFVSSTLQTASERGINLDSFQQVQQIYVDSLMGGRIGKYYETILEEIVPDIETQKKIIDLLANEENKTAIEVWRKRLHLMDGDFRNVLKWLNIHEIIRLNSGLIELSAENYILLDYIKTRYSLEILGISRAMVVGNLLADSLKRAPDLMARFYRRSNAVGIRQLLLVFNCQEIPSSIFDYERFKANLKGAEDAEILSALAQEGERIKLPQIVYTANSVAFYPPINKVSDDERSAVALGFENGNYSDENEIVWIAAEVDSKLEASAELVEFWCDRLEVIALMCNFINYKIWLVTSEGFSSEALEILKQRQAFGSNHQQLSLLGKYLKVENLVKDNLKPNEYEMIVPMGDDTEMIAAHAIEEIARRHHFEPRAINQIKTALVEACINASEHSMSPDRKIYQRFTVEDDRIIITVTNRGLKIPSHKLSESKEISPDSGRRGWGLKLIKNLMDDVKFEQVDDGTRISMVKYLKKATV